MMIYNCCAIDDIQGFALMRVRKRKVKFVLRASDWIPEILLGFASYCSAVRLRLRSAQDDTGEGCDSPGDINPSRDLRYTLSAR